MCGCVFVCVYVLFRVCEVVFVSVCVVSVLCV